VIGGVYGILGVAWILFSDALTASIATSQSQLTTMQSNKGIAYVAVSANIIAVLVYGTVRRHANQLQFTTDALDALQDPFYVLDTDGELLRWNRSAIETTGYTPEDFTEISATELFVEDDRDRVRESITTVLQEGAETIEAKILTADNREIPHEFRTRRFTTADGQVVGIVGIGRDISERRERDRHIQVLDQFLRHNIRNTINIIMGNAQLLETNPEDVDARAEKIRTEGNTLLDQVEKHRQIVTLFTDAEPTEKVDISTVVTAEVTKFRDRYAEVEYRVETPPTAEIYTFERIGSAIAELIENASNHDDGESRTVAVTVEDTGDAVTIQVRYNGAGVPPVERAVLLGEHEIDQLHHGAGFGLWLPYWMSHLVGGHLEIEETEPDGATVTMYHPRRQ
jgi:PAS domain S-box-containing protein